MWLQTPQHVVVNFLVFRREVELQSFYSAILILSSHFKVSFLEIRELPLMSQSSGAIRTPLLVQGLPQAA